MYRLLNELLSVSRNSARLAGCSQEKHDSSTNLYYHAIRKEDVPRIQSMPYCKKSEPTTDQYLYALNRDNYEHKCHTNSKSFLGLSGVSKHLTELKRTLETLPWTGTLASYTTIILLDTPLLQHLFDGVSCCLAPCVRVQLSPILRKIVRHCWGHVSCLSFASRYISVSQDLCDNCSLAYLFIYLFFFSDVIFGSK